MIADDAVATLAQAVVELARDRELTGTTAESCTAGEVAAALSRAEGAGDCFVGGVVAYDREVTEGAPRRSAAARPMNRAAPSWPHVLVTRTAAVGTPVVSLYAPTVPALRWRPWRVPHVLLGDQEIGCHECRARVCPRPRQSCLAGVSPRTVADAVESLAPAPDARTAPAALLR